MPLGNDQNAPALFYDFSTRERPNSSGFSISAGLSTLSCQVSRLTLDYVGRPPRRRSLARNPVIRESGNVTWIILRLTKRKRVANAGAALPQRRRNHVAVEIFLSRQNSLLLRLSRSSRTGRSRSIRTGGLLEADHVTKLTIYLGTAPVLFYDFSTRGRPSSSGFSISAGAERVVVSSSPFFEESWHDGLH
jgi:hypothetical protein